MNYESSSYEESTVIIFPIPRYIEKNYNLAFPVPITQRWKSFTSWEFIGHQSQVESTESWSFGKAMCNIARFNLES